MEPLAPVTMTVRLVAVAAILLGILVVVGPMIILNQGDSDSDNH